MNTLQVIEETELMIREKFEGEGTGHDWLHIDRVRRMARLLAQEEGADMQLVELGALLHDIDDWKFNDGDVDAGPEKARQWILDIGGTETLSNQIKQMISETTFKGAGVETSTSSIESACVQDADRLDALGAIGVARAFAYGGSKRRLLWNPDEENEQHASFEDYKKNTSSTIGHFYEKLFLLKDRMQTESGREIAEKRHAFLHTFVDQFKKEWWGEE